MIERFLTHAERRRRGRRRPRTVLALTMDGLGLLGLAASTDRRRGWCGTPASARPSASIASSPARTWNAATCACPPAEVLRRLAAERSYLPQNVPLIKRVAALDNHTICAAGAMAFRQRPRRCRTAGARSARPSAACLERLPDPRTGRCFPADGRRHRLLRRPVFRAGASDGDHREARAAMGRVTS